MIGQISSSFSNLLYHGIKINHFPGEYPQALKVNLISDTACKLEFSTSGLNISKTKNSCSFDVKQTVQISLRLCKKGVWLDTIYTGTYIIGKKSDLPVVCLNLKRENFDLPDGIITGGIKPAEPPDSGSVTYGRVWKKESIPVFVEYYEKGKAPYAAMLRVKPFGGMTISMPEVSLRLITDSAFGPKKIKFSPFLNKKFNSYKSLVLRTSGNDQAITRIKDITLSSVARDLKLDYMDYRQAVLYVNGEYWGIYNIREKVNHEFLQYNHGASKDPMQTKIDITGIGLPEYQEMLDYVKRPFEEKNVINEINKKLVFENYIDYIILEIHIINIDSRGNVRFWKSKNLDNRWRWIYFDGDQSCFPYQVDFNYLQKRLSTTYIEWCNPDWVTVTLRNLLTHKSTKNFFINEYCLLMGTRLNKDTLINRVNLFAGNIRPEIPAHVMRRNRISYQTVENWENEIEKFKDFFRKREQTAYKHLRETFSLSGQLKNLQISSNINGLKAIRLQHSSYLFDRAEAKFFTDIPVSFEAVEINPKYKFSKWEMPEIDTTKICTLNVGKVEKLKAIFERVPFSQYKNGLRISFIAKKESKKDSIYILGIANRSGKRLDNLKLFLKNTTEKNVLEFELDSLQNEDIFFVSNNSAEAEKLTGKEFRIKKVMFPSRFNFSNSEWVLLDRNGNIIDSLSLGLNDSVFSGKKTTYFYRDEKSNTWKFSGKFLKKEKAVVIKNESVFNKLLLVA
ncbi:MAG: CotH kinase family protein, partial [Bacteroidota bacterium]